MCHIATSELAMMKEDLGACMNSLRAWWHWVEASTFWKLIRKFSNTRKNIGCCPDAIPCLHGGGRSAVYKQFNKTKCL